VRKGIVLGLVWWLAHNFLAGRLAVSKNFGISFGIQVAGEWVVLALFLMVILIKNKNWGWLMIFSGGLANVIDRLIFGYVRDYCRLPVVGAFSNNINDWLIFVGFILILWSLVRKKSK